MLPCVQGTHTPTTSDQASTPKPEVTNQQSLLLHPTNKNLVERNDVKGIGLFMFDSNCKTGRNFRHHLAKRPTLQTKTLRFGKAK